MVMADERVGLRNCAMYVNVIFLVFSYI